MIILIRTLALTKDKKLKENIALKDLKSSKYEWYWIDFDTPTVEECKLLETHFHFHHLAIEDCLHLLQRPKMDLYSDHIFFVFQAFDDEKLIPIEVNMFAATNYVVTFHQTHLSEIDEAWDKIKTSDRVWDDGTIYICYQILDKLVDNYFPYAYKLEDIIDEIDDNEDGESLKNLMDQIFGVRSELLKFRRIVTQMRDLLYRMLNSEVLEVNKESSVYFLDVYDHLLRLSEMIESCQALTSEIRDSYVALNSYKMNRVMMLLTVITTIFIPLTFIVGVYGMNFHNIPELSWKYGYYIIMGVMATLSIAMFVWFKKKGWFKMD